MHLNSLLINLLEAIVIITGDTGLLLSQSIKSREICYSFQLYLYLINPPLLFIHYIIFLLHINNLIYFFRQIQIIIDV